MKYLNFILNLENLFIFYDRIEFQKSILTLFEQFDDKLGYVDSFNAIVCKKNEIDYLISHDKDYDSIDGIVRIQAPPINF